MEDGDLYFCVAADGILAWITDADFGVLASASQHAESGRSLVSPSSIGVGGRVQPGSWGQRRTENHRYCLDAVDRHRLQRGK